MRRPLFAALTIVLVVLAVEVVSFLVLAVLTGGLPTWGDLAEARAERQAATPFAPAAHQAKDWRAHRIREVPSLHPYLGYVSDPTTHPWADHPEVSRQALEYGFPGNRHDLFQGDDPELLVVGVFGGSFALDLALAEAELVPALESVPRFAGRRPIVLGFAGAGYKQPQQLMALSYFLALGARLDVIVHVDGFNEIALPPATNVPLGYASFYPRGWLLQVADLDPELRRRLGEVTYLHAERARRGERFSDPPLRYSMTAALVELALDRRLAARINAAELELATTEREPSASYQARGPRRPYPDEAAMYDDLAEIWRRSAFEMHALASGLGIEYHHFLQPNQYLDGAKPLSAEERRRFFDPDHPYAASVGKGYPRLRAAGAELRASGVSFHDLSGIFGDVEETRYRDTCCHLNAQGVRRVAAAIGEAIAASYPSDG